MFQPGDDPFNTITPDPIATADADNIVVFVKRTLGDDIVSVELTDKEIYNAFEQSIQAFSMVINEYNGKSNLSNFLGTSTGTLSGAENSYTVPTLSWYINQAEQYGAEAGVGGNQPSFLGSITLTPGQQSYSLTTGLSSSFQSSYGESIVGNGIRIIELYHVDPANAYAAYGDVGYAYGNQYAGGSAVPSTQYQILPIFDSILRRATYKQAVRVRLSHYSYNVIGNDLILYPVPWTATTLWMRYRRALSAYEVNLGTASGSISGTPGSAFSVSAVSSLANMPYGVIPYKNVNQWGRHWIWQHTLALSKITLGNVRRKVSSGIHYPGGVTLTLDGGEQVSEGIADRDRLLEKIREVLEALSYDKLAEIEAAKAESLNKVLSYVPLGIYVK